MNDSNNTVELARELAEIARTTTDPDTGRLLMELVHRLLTEAGLPPSGAGGGGEPPSHWVLEASCEPACA